MPKASTLADVARKPLMLECASEFSNFIQLALDGVKFCRLEFSPTNGMIEFPAQVISNFNRQVLYIRQRTVVSAYHVANIMKQFGDIYVVKDSMTACFVEFQYIIDADENSRNNSLVVGNDIGEYDEETQERKLRQITLSGVRPERFDSLGS